MSETPGVEKTIEKQLVAGVAKSSKERVRLIQREAEKLLRTAEHGRLLRKDAA